MIKWFRSWIKANRDLKAAREASNAEWERKKRELNAKYDTMARDAFEIKRQRKLKEMAEERAYRDNIQIIADHIRKNDE